MSNGSQIPPTDPTSPELDLAYQSAPILVFEDDEPFLPLVAGCTIFHGESDSPSFPRKIEHAYLPAWETAIEYAIWWDWDIGHLYELEHTWSYLDTNGELVWVEASWHGNYSVMILNDESIPCQGTHPLVYSQPGKHAFAPEPFMFRRILPYVMKETGPGAGNGGVLLKDEYRGLIHKSPQADALVSAYLKARAFTPSFNFNQFFPLRRTMLVPWPTLQAWIPARVNWWIEELARSS